MGHAARGAPLRAMIGGMNRIDSPHAARRARLAALMNAQMGPGAIAIIPTAPEQQRNRDSDFPYRADSYFWYLTGFEEPQAWLVLAADGRSTLFCQPRDAEREVWTGYRLGPEAAPAALGVDEAFAVTELDACLPRLLENRATVCYPFATHAGLESRVDGWLHKVRARARYGALTPETQRDACALLDEMRLTKDAHELALMRRAGAISARGHIRAMQRSARMLRAGEDVREYHLEAELLHEFRQHGSEYPAYTIIVAAGANAILLRYRTGQARVHVQPAGGEIRNPLFQRFRGPRRALYGLVLASQDAAAAATRPGARFNDPHEAAVKVLAQGLLDLRLLDADKVGGAQDVIAQRAYFPFYMHRTSHWLGLDVHDCGSYVEPSELGQVSERTDPLSGEVIKDRPSRILRAGMVLTLEPGLYVRPGEGVPQEFWNLGIRIEDDAVVTETGCELMSRGVPVAPDEIEAVMRG